MFTVGSVIKYIKPIKDQHRITVGRMYIITKIDKGIYYFLDDSGVIMDHDLRTGQVVRPDCDCDDE